MAVKGRPRSVGDGGSCCGAPGRLQRAHPGGAPAQNGANEPARAVSTCCQRAGDDPARLRRRTPDGRRAGRGVPQEAPESRSSRVHPVRRLREEHQAHDGLRHAPDLAQFAVGMDDSRRAATSWTWRLPRRVRLARDSRPPAWTSSPGPASAPPRAGTVRGACRAVDDGDLLQQGAGREGGDHPAAPHDWRSSRASSPPPKRPGRRRWASARSIPAGSTSGPRWSTT